MTARTETDGVTPEFFATPGYGDLLRDLLHYSQAVRIGNRVETSGQGGWDDELNIPEALEDEITLAFANVGRTLAAAGATWHDVVALNSYHRVDSAAGFESHNRVMVQQFRVRLDDRMPIWTQTATPTLALAAMRIELRATAVIGAGNG